MCMGPIEKNFKDLECGVEKRNDIEVDYWKKLFLAKNPIPSPIISKNDEIIAFHNCFFAMLDIGLKKGWFMQE
jgi:hypothetical protein